MKFLTLLLFLTLSGLFPVCAQLEVRLKPTRNTFIEGENPTLKLTITNRTGSEVNLSSDGLTSWLDFKVTTRKGEILSPVNRELFQRVVIPRGRAMSRNISLGRYYSFRKNGLYTARANIDYQGQDYSSNGAHFNVVTAPTIWAKRVGVPEGEEGAGNRRLYSLKRAVVDRTTRLFASLEDETTGRTLKIIQLGQALSSSEEQGLIDADHTLHVLFQNTGVLYVHSQLDIQGNYLGHEIFKRSTTKPRLVTGPDGNVVVVGGVPFDPKKEAEERNRIRRVSERPDIIFK